MVQSRWWLPSFQARHQLPLHHPLGHGMACSASVVLSAKLLNPLETGDWVVPLLPPLAHWFSLPLCQPCSFFPPGQAGLLLAGQCLLQSQVTSPSQKHFLVPPACTHDVVGLTRSPHLCLLCHRMSTGQGLLLLAPGYPQHLTQNYACSRHSGLLSQVMNRTCLRVMGGLNQAMQAKNLGGLLGGSHADDGPGAVFTAAGAPPHVRPALSPSASYLRSSRQLPLSQPLYNAGQSQSSPDPRPPSWKW